MMTTAPLLIRACRGEPVERTPVWAMRQAGRWDPEFQKLREGHDFFAFSENPELAAQASLCPLRFGVDAIILFYDIATLAIAMGQKFELVPDRGPVPLSPIRSLEDVERLSAHPDPSLYRHVLEMLRLVRSALPPEIPILVFAGAPFTIAAYQIAAGRNIAAVRRFIAEQSQCWNRLLDKNAAAAIGFLKTLLEAGADAYQLFDSWAGQLQAEEYRTFAHRFHCDIFAETGGISILFVKDCPYIDIAAASGAKVLSLGKRHDLRQIRNRYPSLVVQGNVDHELLIGANPDEVDKAARRCLALGGGQRHVLNLDHGMDRRARVENFRAFVDAAKSA